jgi:hypothetical protein
VLLLKELGERYIASIMAWKQLEPTPAHLTFIILSAFLILYALFSSFIRNRLHLSEPPLATLVGIIFGPRGLKIFTPLDWGFGDNVVQELVRRVSSILSGSKLMFHRLVSFSGCSASPRA